MLNSPLVRVKRRSPSPICGKPDWCSVTDDGAMAICMRVAEGAVKESKNGGYIHILEEREYHPLNPIQRKPAPPSVASLERRDSVYKSLLDASTLCARHAADLQRRGLSSLSLARNAYRSLPPSLHHAQKLCEGLQRQGHNLANVPGFFRDDSGLWTLAIHSPSFFVPVRDPRGRIQGMQIRQDRGSRYVWFSSAKEPGGASSAAPVHFARPWRAEATGEAILTEGGLKADVTAELLDACVVGVPGVSAFGIHFGTELKARLPKLDTVIIGYDVDWRSKRQVGEALVRLFDSLADVGLNIVMLNWNNAKGIDDFLVKGVGQ
jgi:hypothetical protein